MWFNTISRTLNLTNNFELDYLGLSGRQLAKKLSKQEKQTT